MSMTIIIYISKAVVSKLFEAGVKKVLGIEVQGASIGAHAEQLVLAVFTGASLHPEPTFEQKAQRRFHELEIEISGLKKDIADLQDEMADFKWKVQTLLYEAREEDLWQTMLQIENSSDTYYERIKALGASTETIEARKTRSLQLADTILASDVATHIANTKLALLGDVVGAGKQRVRGFLEIWQQQALREADLGWQGDRLQQIYDVLEAKFTRALLIQIKCVRLMMEGHEARHKHDPSHKSAADYFVDTFYPILKAEVAGFRDVIESLAINLMPLPDRGLATVSIPDEIAGLLASIDVYSAQALSGRVSVDAAPAGPGRTLDGVPALSGCWGRVIVPGTRWIRRSPGSKEPARAVLTTPSGQAVACKGRLEVRAIGYTPYEGKSGTKLHEGYQLVVNNTPRDMDKMLLAQFIPEEVLPSDLSGSLDVRIEDQTGDVLARTKALVVPITTDAEQKNMVPYGTFTMSFTGGAEVRRR
jgi:hypothetical protein